MAWPTSRGIGSRSLRPPFPRTVRALSWARPDALSTLRSFAVSVDGGSHAVVEIFVRLLNDRTGVVRAAKAFEATAPVSGQGNDAYVHALDAAFGESGAEIVGWVDSLV